MRIEDGATNWGDAGPKLPAKGFNMKDRQASIYEWIRQIRGGVLGGAFTVELHMRKAIICFMLGNRIKRDDVQDVFDEGLLALLTFERCINVTLLIAPHFMEDDEVKTLKGDLTELRTIRNSMAHKPFWFHPELNKDGEVCNLVPMIQRGKGSIPLTTSFIETLNEKVASLIRRSSKLAFDVAKRETDDD